MLLPDIKIVSRQEMKLIGFSSKASLNDEIQFNIVKNLREKILNHFSHIKQKISDSIFLIQIYEEVEWTPDTLYTHIVAVEVEDFSFIPKGMLTHTIPKGEFLIFKHQGIEEDVGSTYIYINEWLENNNYDTLRPFDMEQWLDLKSLSNSDNIIKIYIPL
ncbi:GyrI-like domain-containing protein [Lysinibacillus sphaericus]|uniref:GyrI-like domain-containing protein n=1 Tax=Lysinibacillus sphaericus TaxID=1421 RepID=UPI00296E5218